MTTAKPKLPRITIRQARKTELETVWNIERRNLLENWDWHPATPGPLNEAAAERLQRATVRRWFDPGRHKLLVAECEGQLVGMAWYALEHHPLFQFYNGFLYSIVVDPTYRRRGVASRLMREFMRRSRLAGAKWVRLNVLHANTRAQNLYRRFGFFDEAHVMVARLEPAKPEKAKAEARARRAQDEEAPRKRTAVAE